MSKVEIDEKELDALRMTARDVVNLAAIETHLRDNRGQVDDDWQSDMEAKMRVEDALLTDASILVANYGYTYPPRVDFSLPENEHLEAI
jgi:hypothetical protein